MSELAARLLEADPAQDPWTFEASLTNDKIEVSGHYEDRPYLDADAQLTVVWQADFDVRSWGIKEILPILKKITGQLSLSDEDGREVQRIPITWPSSASPRDVQRVMGTAVPAAQANPKDWINYYGSAHGDWTVEPEYWRTGGQTSISLSVRGAEINVKERHISIRF